VRGKSAHDKTYALGRFVGFRALELSIRRKAFSGIHPSCPYRHGDVRSFGSKVNLGDILRKAAVIDSGSVSTEAGRACLRATMRASEGRPRFGEGSTRSEKVQAGFASSTLKRRR